MMMMMMIVSKIRHNLFLSTSVLLSKGVEREGEGNGGVEQGAIKTSQAEESSCDFPYANS